MEGELEGRRRGERQRGREGRDLVCERIERETGERRERDGREKGDREGSYRRERKKGKREEERA
eukprot:454317-Amorphochlora_amoeboformis.AAC.1